MAKTKIVRIQDLLGMVHALAPPVLAEEWDNVGLQVGDPNAEVQRVVVALDPTEAAVEAAVAANAGALVCHHPLLFRPLRQVSLADETGRCVAAALRHDLAIIAAHTNLDRAADGLNDWLATRLGLQQAVPLEAPEGLLFKLAVFVPADHREAVAEALFAAGAGSIGAYDRCGFFVEGTGSFRPGEGTQPFIGAIGETTLVDEVRLETVVPKEALSKVVARMLKAHPYEEVAYDLLPLTNSRSDVGLGRIGRLPAQTTLAAFSDEVKSALGVPHLRRVGDASRPVAKVAVCGGSGASLLAAAVRQGADVLVTGDVGYHDARRAESLGIALLDAGHFATERIMIDGLSGRLAALAQQRGLPLDIHPFTGESDPLQVV